MYKSEALLFDQLKVLKNVYNIQGIKAEFEAEGSSYRDVNRLQRLCGKLGVPVHLKIGGVEAVRDIKDAIELGVSGLIAPMVESEFAAKKFLDAIKKYQLDSSIHKSLNIETSSGVKNIKKIIKISSGIINNITIGRSDLTASFFKRNLKPDSDFIFKIIEGVAPFAIDNGMSVTIGGSVTQETIKMITENHTPLIDMISHIETRKVMFNTADIIDNGKSIENALKFEEIYILSKKDFSDMKINAEISRLPELSRRIKS